MGWWWGRCSRTSACSSGGGRAPTSCARGCTSSTTRAPGAEACRPAYLDALRGFLATKELCKEHRDRSVENPLRVLDCKRDECRAATAGATRMVDHLCDDCRPHFERVQRGLTALGIPFE